MTRFETITILAAAATLGCAHHGGTQARSKMPPPQPVFERQIRNAIDAGDGDLALRALREKMIAEPANLDVRLALAEAYLERGFPEVAAEHYRLAAARFPESAAAVVGLARTLRAMNLRLEAAQALERFLAARPDQPARAVSWLGIVRDELGQWTEGEKSHRAALELNPGSDSLHNNLGYNLLQQGRRDDAAREFEEALRLNPASAPARNNLGLALANKADQALAEWKKAGDPASAHSNLAAAMIEEGRYAEARKELDAALGYNKLHSAALNNLRLVSQLDGKPATLRMELPVETKWARWRSALLTLFVGPVPGEPRPAAPSAPVR